MPDLGYGPGLHHSSEAADQPVIGFVELADGGSHKVPFKKARLQLATNTDDVQEGGVAIETVHDRDGSKHDCATDDVKDNVAAADSIGNSSKSGQKASYVFKSCMPSLQAQGHTGYLTFATLYPS